MPQPVPVSFSGWRSPSFSQPPVISENKIVLKGAGAALAVTAVTDDIVRVRFVPMADFGRDHSYARSGQSLPKATTRIEEWGGETTLTTASLRVVIHHAPLRITFTDLAGNVLDEDAAGLGIAWAGSRVQVGKLLADESAIYGLGEKTGRLNKRGWCLGGYSYAMWATDAYAYDQSTDPLYVSVPYYLSLRGGRAYGIFLDNTHRTFFDIGRQQRGVLTFGAEGGELDYYFINGPQPRDVSVRYGQLTGRAPMPPRWALGYHQSRWSYYPESRVRKLAADFRSHRVPGEVIWLDVHHLDGYAPFTWDGERFPNPKKLCRELAAQGFRVIPIVDPHIKAERGHGPFESGRTGGHFIKNADGSIYRGPVWPSNAEKNPQLSVFPDFTQPAAREWWGTLFKELVDIGVAGIWNDMNEPAVFVPPTKTLLPEMTQDNEGEPAPHAAVHNVYGMLNSRATFEGLRRLRPEQRAFVLTRSSFAGGQRYAAVWTGDNSSEWSHLQQSIPMLLGLSVSGFPFVGADIGGFAGTASPELFTRWLQAGVFYPFMRAHTEINTPDQEPWAYGERYESLNRKAIELRYELLPYLYSVMAQSVADGVPAMRPLFWEHADESGTWDVDDTFLFGSDLLAAPVLKEGQTQRGVYLPSGEWFDYWTGRKVAGGQMNYLPVTIDSIPMFIRAGGVIFKQPVVQHTGEMPGQPLIVQIYPATTESTAWYYEDDGETVAHERGVVYRRRFTHKREVARVTVDIAAPEGSYRPMARDLIVRVQWGEVPPALVSVDGQVLPRSYGLATKVDSWRWAESDMLEIRMRDSSSPLRFIISR